MSNNDNTDDQIEELKALSRELNHEYHKFTKTCLNGNSNIDEGTQRKHQTSALAQMRKNTNAMKGLLTNTKYKAHIGDIRASTEMVIKKIRAN